MKRTLVCLLVTFFAASGFAVAAQTEISASGTGSVALPPDVATVAASVETNDASAENAIAQNNRVYDRVVAALSNLGIARNDVALSDYNVGYVPRPRVVPVPPTGERYGYTVSRAFAVTVRSIGKAGSVSDACVGAGATAINGVSFGLSNPSVARAQAIDKAEADARANADALAKTAGLRIVGIKSIGVSNYAAPLGGLQAKVMSGTNFDQSNVNVTVSVDAVFLAEP